MTLQNGYITLEELKQHMGKKLGDTSNNALFENSIESASREIDMAITGLRDYVVFKEHVLDESKVMFDMGMNDDGLIMNYARTRIYAPDNIKEITAIVDDTVELSVGTDYNLGRMFIQATGRFTTDQENGVLISGTISSDTVPDEIKNLCKNMAEVLTGMSTRIVTDSDGNDVEIRLKNYPGWVTKKLKSLRMPIY